MAEHYDIAVIGSGQAGSPLAAALAEGGSRVALVEGSLDRRHLCQHGLYADQDPAQDRAGGSSGAQRGALRSVDRAGDGGLHPCDGAHARARRAVPGRPRKVAGRCAWAGPGAWLGAFRWASGCRGRRGLSPADHGDGGPVRRPHHHREPGLPEHRHPPDGEGGYTVWGKLLPAATSLALGGVPLGLAHGVKVVRPVKAGQSLSWADVAMDTTTHAWRTRKAMEDLFATPALKVA